MADNEQKTEISDAARQLVLAERQKMAAKKIAEIKAKKNKGPVNNAVAISKSQESDR